MSLLFHLETLFQHSAWADQRFVERLRAIAEPPATVLRELAHIRGAQATWFARLHGTTATLPVWPDFTVDQLADEGTRLDTTWRGWLATCTDADLDRVLHYKNLAGDPFETPVGQVLLHVAMHGQYHRGKANVALRAASHDPVAADFIAFLRTPAARVPTSSGRPATG